LVGRFMFSKQTLNPANCYARLFQLLIRSG
jgi:hypothetical protein